MWAGIHVFFSPSHILLYLLRYIDPCPLQSRRRKDNKMTGNTISINTGEIPEFRCNELAEFALMLVREVFSAPGEEERYQSWLSEYKKKKE